MITTVKQTRKELTDYATALPHGYELAHIVLDFETCICDNARTLYFIHLTDEGHEEDNPVTIAFGNSDISGQDAIYNLQEDMREYMALGSNSNYIAAIGIAMAYIAQSGKWQ